MRALVAALVMLGLAVTGSASCAMAQTPPVVAGEQQVLPPCHDAMSASAHETPHGALHGDDACSGGAACIDCALAAGLSAEPASLNGKAFNATVPAFAVKSASPRPLAHDPPPPRI